MRGRQSSLFQPLQASPVSRNMYSSLFALDALRRKLLELLSVKLLDKSWDSSEKGLLWKAVLAQNFS